MDNQPTICSGVECRYKRSLFRLTRRVNVFPPLGALSKLAGRRSVDSLVQADRLAPDMARETRHYNGGEAAFLEKFQKLL
jgi:hypothetical protein